MNRYQWITQAACLQAAHKPFALVTVLRVQAPASAKAGDKAVVTPDGQIHGWIGGGCAQPVVIKSVRRALLDGKAHSIRIAPSDTSAERDLGDVLEFGMACHSGGTLELFIDPILPPPTLAVVGDSPVARALVSLAPRVGLRVAVVAHAAQAADFADAETVLTSDDMQEVVRQLPCAFVVVATQGRRDVQGLKAALALQPQGLWFVASARKAKVLFDSLITGGADPAAVARIVAPAGTAIGAQAPEEIALSVLTSVVAAATAARHESTVTANTTPTQATAMPLTPTNPAGCSGKKTVLPEAKALTPLDLVQAAQATAARASRPKG